MPKKHKHGHDNGTTLHAQKETNTYPYTIKRMPPRTSNVCKKISENQAINDVRY